MSTAKEELYIGEKHGRKDSKGRILREGESQRNLNKRNSIKGSKITLNECIELYLDISKFANSTYNNYMDYYERHIKVSWLGAMKAIDIKKLYILH